MDITIIGTGNTATVLGRKLKEAGHHILQVAGRNPKQAAVLAADLGAEPVSPVTAIGKDADLYLLAVSDAAIEPLAGSLPLSGKTVVHTAGSVSLNVLKGKVGRHGVFYPLQSLKKEVRQLPAIPILIDAGDAETMQLLQRLAYTISQQVMVANDEQRMHTHLAAVMVNNFTNHLFVLVEEFCQQQQVDFSILQPLMVETVLRLREASPITAQTGPAIRNDNATIERHLSLLQATPHLQTFYRFFSSSIQEKKNITGGSNR